MTAAVWRPKPAAGTYPVLGVESYRCNGTAEAVLELADGSHARVTVLLSDVIPYVTPRLTDNSMPDSCGCGERAEGQLTPLSPRTQAPDVEEASGAPKPTQQ
ncbi:hypothetical protein PP512_gp40 [Gordonia phage Denise]|uniref:DUF7323 domain-containing protein n=1 Tax=Gordonia phage Denise TaxID=2652879 RepID=A0A5P8DCH0_9CAUD|nr:hypothetical protein PP512_gp40 [Gordonia phage Denise]QFP96694.1 hypothetical protein SEA_DENISE_40 [Gordonia phage Denise]